jgi:hypothetical protein
MLPAFIVCAAALLGCFGTAIWITARQPAAGRHARRAAASAEGDRFVAELRGEDPPPEEQPGPPGRGDPDDTAWWDVTPPQPPAVEVLTGPGAPIRQTSEVTIGVLARVRDKLLPDAWRPPPPTFTPADPDATMTDLPAIAGAPQYLAAPQ